MAKKRTIYLDDEIDLEVVKRSEKEGKNYSEIINYDLKERYFENLYSFLNINEPNYYPNLWFDGYEKWWKWITYREDKPPEIKKIAKTDEDTKKALEALTRSKEEKMNYEKVTKEKENEIKNLKDKYVSIPQCKAGGILREDSQHMYCFNAQRDVLVKDHCMKLKRVNSFKKEPCSFLTVISFLRESLKQYDDIDIKILNNQ